MADITERDRRVASDILLRIFPQDSLLAGNNKNSNMIEAVAQIIAHERQISFLDGKKESLDETIEMMEKVRMP